MYFLHFNFKSYFEGLVDAASTIKEVRVLENIYKCRSSKANQQARSCLSVSQFANVLCKMWSMWLPYSLCVFAVGTVQTRDGCGILF